MCLIDTAVLVKKFVSGTLLAVAFLGVCPVAGLAADQVALIIGNSKYDNGPDLQTPLNDSTEVAKKFSKLGYDTVLVRNGTRAQIMLALAKLRIRSANAEKVVIYFAGHGVQRAGQSHLLGVDSEFAGSDSQKSMISLSILIRSISDKARQKLIFIDACRDNLANENDRNELLGPLKSETPAGLFLMHAAQPGAAAFDGTNNHSPFAKAFLTHLERREEIDAFARRVRVDVIRATQGVQVPWSQSSLMRPAFLN